MKIPAPSPLWQHSTPLPPEEVTRHGKQAHLGPPVTGPEGAEGGRTLPATGVLASASCSTLCTGARPWPRGTASLWEALLPWRVFRALLLCHLSTLFLSGCRYSACSLSVKASFTVTQAEQKLPSPDHSLLLSLSTLPANQGHTFKIICTYSLQTIMLPLKHPHLSTQSPLKLLSI